MADAIVSNSDPRPSSERIAEIMDKLARLRAGDPSFQLFGASDHRYALNPPLSCISPFWLSELLPDDYKEFLLSAGNGGAGPYYGILSLDQSLAWVVEEHERTDLLGRELLLTEDVDFGELLDAPKDWEEHVARLRSDPEYEQAWERLRQEYQEKTAGAFPICTYGCGDYFVLALRGPSRGTVWANALGSSTGFYSTRLSFLGFYEAWLDDALDRVSRGEYRPRNAMYGVLEYSRNPRYRAV